MKVVKQFMIYETILDAFCSSAYKAVQSKGSFVLKEIPSNQRTYRKIPKISPGLYFSKPIFEGLIFGGAYIRRGLSTEGNLSFKIDWDSLIVGSKFAVFALFYFVFEGNFPSTSPRGAYIWRGDLTEGFLCHPFGGLIFGGAYTWRGLFSGILRYL